MMMSILIKFLEALERIITSRRRYDIFLLVFGLVSLALSVIIHELGHMIAAHLLGYEYTVIPAFGEGVIKVTIMDLDHGSLDPLIIGSSGGYLVTAVFAPLVYLLSKWSGTKNFSSDARMLFTDTYVILASFMIIHFVYGTLEGVANQTYFLTFKTAGIVGSIVAYICFAIMFIHEYCDTERILQKLEDLKDTKIINKKPEEQ